jgi:methionine-rich copper-binding protein CopC
MSPRQPPRRSTDLRGWTLRAVAVLGLVLAGFAVAGPASAHNLLEGTSPADGSTVATVPATVTLTFNEPALALGSVIQVVGPSGNVAEGAPVLVDRYVRQPIKAGAPAGAYQVLWRVTSLDGHPISGQFAFSATAGSPGSTTAGSGAAPAGQATAAAQSPADSGSGSGGSSLLLIVLLVVVGLIIAGGAVFVLRGGSGPSES